MNGFIHTYIKIAVIALSHFDKIETSRTLNEKGSSA